MMIRSAVLVLILLMSACGISPSKWDVSGYTVRSGDTLYSIAWRFELDPDQLASWNQLQNTDLIYPGQRLRTTPPKESMVEIGRTMRPVERTEEPPPQVQPRSVTVQQDETMYRIAIRNKLTVDQLASYNGISKPYVIKPGQRLYLQPKTSTARTNVTRKPSKQERSVQAAKYQSIQWQWPIRGKIIKTFNSRLTDAKGIDILGTRGSPVKAAASGKVVYSGDGLISYGNLIIIKHNAIYLSAYAHNDRLLVEEGETVTAGQVIAELGQSGADSPRLHFEIRKNGKPVNPGAYLPRS